MRESYASDRYPPNRTDIWVRSGPSNVADSAEKLYGILVVGRLTNWQRRPYSKQAIAFLPAWLQNVAGYRSPTN